MRCMIFKTFKKRLCIIALAIVQDRERPYNTVRDRVRPYETIYTTAHEVHYTSELNRVNIVYKLYGIKLNHKSAGPYANPVNVQLIE